MDCDNYEVGRRSRDREKQIHLLGVDYWEDAISEFVKTAECSRDDAVQFLDVFGPNPRRLKPEAWAALALSAMEGIFS